MPDLATWSGAMDSAAGVVSSGLPGGSGDAGDLAAAFAPAGLPDWSAVASDPTAWFTQAGTQSWPTVPSMSDWYTPPAVPTVPTIPTMSATSAAPTWFMTFGAVATGGTSMFDTSFAAEQAKAQAVYTMRVYESSLSDGGDLVATHASGAYGTDRTPVAGMRQPVGGQFAGPQPGGVPWSQLVADPLRPGPAVGGGAIAGAPAPHGVMAPETAAGRAAGHPGMVPPVGQRPTRDEDEDHRNRMPVIDHGLFVNETRTSAAVIGVIH